MSRVRSMSMFGALVLLGGCPESDSSEPRTDAGSNHENVEHRRLDMLDLLFVIDNSPSMGGAQAALQAQLPGLIERLASGARSEGDPNAFAPITDMHIGVISSDMGIPGVQTIQSCDPDGGDDSVLQRSVDCGPIFPRFIRYRSTSNIDELGTDLSCTLALGTNGCAIQQPLDAALKAVTTKNYVDIDGDIIGPNPFRFIATSQEGVPGKGDRENLDFVRMDERDGASLLAIVVLTAGEDCSMRDTGPLAHSDIDLDLSCFVNKQVLYNVKERFYEGFQKLRPGRGDDVVFAAIAGVPRELVDADVHRKVDWQDEESRSLYYTTLLRDLRMQQELDASTDRDLHSGALRPSCVWKNSRAGESSKAYPPRRIVELASHFGQNGIVQSICDEDLGRATSAIADLIQARMAGAKR